MLGRFGCYCMELAAIHSILGASSDCACCYAGYFAVFINSNFWIDDGVSILHINGSAFTIHHSCYSGITIQRDFSRTIGNDITTDVDTSKLSSLICNNVVLGRDRASCLNRPICSANADVVASRFPQENIIIQANLVNLLPVDFCFLYIDIAAIDNLNVHCLCLAHSHNASKSQCS